MLPCLPLVYFLVTELFLEILITYRILNIYYTEEEGKSSKIGQNESRNKPTELFPQDNPYIIIYCPFDLMRALIHDSWF